MLPQDRDRSQLFGHDAHRYDRARPSYPQSLIDDLTADKADRVLDVGCGTGKAARLFVARGCQVMGIEPDARMAAIARTYGLPVEVATFEAWDPAGRTFDMLICGQAWHWIDRQIGPRKAASLLPSGGRLAIFWNRGTHDAKVRALLDEAYRRHAPGMRSGYAPLANAKQTNTPHIEAIATTGSFGTPEVRLYKWSKQYSRQEWLDQLGTHSDHLTLPPSQFEALAGAIAAIIDQLGGTITVCFQTELIFARKK